MALLEATGIVKTYPGVQALAGVDLQVDPGEVHALLGENGAGKSTLMKVVAGSVVPDAGELAVDGRPVPYGYPEASRSRGIGIVYQELSLVPTLSLAENVLLGRWPTTRWGTLDWRGLERRAVRYLSRVGLEVEPGSRVASLDMSERQLVEVAKALSTDARLLLLDEPTSALSEPETERLFRIIGNLRSSGVAVVYVSHRLSEVMEIADRVTVLRDGSRVATRDIGQVTEGELARMMVGREVGTPLQMREARSRPREGVALRARGLARPPRLAPADLELRAGEVVGVFGLVGSGRSRLGRTLFGLEPATRGSLEVFGQEVDIGSPAEAIRHGVGYLPAERFQGVVPRLTVAANITLASLGRLGRGPVLDSAAEAQMADRFIRELDIRVASPKQPAENLSGGNQQKTLLARWLCSHSRIMLLDDPTRGIDVGAKEEVFRLVTRLASEGTAVLYLTSEVKEARALSDRILIMAGGRIVGETPPDTPEDVIMGIAGGVRG